VIYRRKVYKIDPENAEAFHRYFHDCLLPGHLKHGARLAGRWTTEGEDEVIAIWEYDSEEDYRRIDRAVRSDPLHALAQSKRPETAIFIESRQDFLTPTGNYAPPKMIVSVSGFITNESGEALLVRTHWRADTWEMPGGQAEEGEPLHDALLREIFEETGIEAALYGMTGIYMNVRRGIVNVAFAGKSVGGAPRTSDETQDVRFVALSEANLSEYVTRPHFRIRIQDAMRGAYAPYEAFDVRPFRSILRLDPESLPPMRLFEGVDEIESN
jgi:ADP-ribose pyrophosphatase YjhB (NUDIX family)